MYETGAMERDDGAASGCITLVDFISIRGALEDCGPFVLHVCVYILGYKSKQIKEGNMDVIASCKAFQCPALKDSSSIFSNNTTYHTLIGLNKITSLPAKAGGICHGHGRRRLCTVVQAQTRPTWLPGLDSPPYLDGTLAGDFGFDPLGLGEDPESLKWYVQAELVHSRFAMAGVAGILFTDLLRVTGLSNLPVWYEAGATKFQFANTTTLFIVQMLLMGFVETKRYMDFKNPGSQAEASFFGLEAALEGLEPGYPGGPILNPLGIAKDIKNAPEWKLKEIKNGRLAMVAILGIFVQASVTHVGPLENLVVHLSDPWHTTIIQILSASNS